MCIAIAMLDRMICRVCCSGCGCPDKTARLPPWRPRTLPWTTRLGWTEESTLICVGHRWESLGSLLAETPDAEIYVPAHPTRSYLSYEDRIRTVLFEVGTRSLGARNLDHLGGDRGAGGRRTEVLLLLVAGLAVLDREGVCLGAALIALHAVRHLHRA